MYGTGVLKNHLAPFWQQSKFSHTLKRERDFGKNRARFMPCVWAFCCNFALKQNI